MNKYFRRKEQVIPKVEILPLQNRDASSKIESSAAVRRENQKKIHLLLSENR